MGSGRDTEETTAAGNCLLLTLGFCLIMFTAIFESSLLEHLLVYDMDWTKMNTLGRLADKIETHGLTLSLGDPGDFASEQLATVTTGDFVRLRQALNNRPVHYESNGTKALLELASAKLVRYSAVRNVVRS